MGLLSLDKIGDQNISAIREKERIYREGIQSSGIVRDDRNVVKTFEQHGKLLTRLTSPTLETN